MSEVSREFDPTFEDFLDRADPDAAYFLRELMQNVSVVIQEAPVIHPRMAMELYQASKGAAEYMHEHDLGNLVLVDRGARPIWAGVREYYSRRFDEDKSPAIFFVNPAAFEGATMADIEAQLPKLAEQKAEGTLILDTCIHTGKTMLPVLGALREAGFSNVRTAVVNDRENNSGFTPDAILLKKTPQGMCYPFDVDEVTVQGDRLHVDIADDKEPLDSLRVAQLREEIRTIVGFGVEYDNLEKRALGVGLLGGVATFAAYEAMFGPDHILTTVGAVAWGMSNTYSIKMLFEHFATKKLQKRYS